MRFLGWMFLVTAWPALAQVAIDNPWARATAPGIKVAAGYMVIRNPGAADRLLGASTSAAERVETHVTVKEGDVARMRQVQGYDVPAGASLELKPGGAHLMFVNIKAPFKEGEKIPVVLRFEKAGEVKAQFHVGRITTGGSQHHHHKGH